METSCLACVKMAEPATIPYFPLAIDARSFDEEVMKLFAHLRPDWKQEDLQVKTYSEGYINQMRRFHRKDDTAKKDAIVVRVYGTSLDMFVDRKKEFMAMQLARAAGCFQPILAVFDNGVAYKYASGRTLKQADLNDPRVIKSVSHKMARLHSTDITKVPLVNMKGEPSEFPSGSLWETNFEAFMADYPEKLDDPEEDKIFQEYGFPIEELKKIFGNLMSIFQEKLPRSLIHGDFHSRNIVFDEETGEATFVDYEMTEVRERYADFVNLLYNRDMLESLGMVSPDEPRLSDDSLAMWKRSYMEEKYRLSGRDPQSITDKVMEKMDLELRILEICMFPGIAMFVGVMCVKKMIPLPVIKLLPSARKNWEATKDELPGLVERYQQYS